MENYFTTCRTIDEAKKIYRAMAMKFHPEHGGSEESFKRLQKQHEDFCARYMSDSYQRYTHETGRTGSANMSPFATVLNAILSSEYYCRVEIIGYWIYVFATREQTDLHAFVKNLGFFFSTKHKAWIYNGERRKKNYRSRFTTAQIRHIHGSRVLRDRETEKQHARIGS